MAFPATSDLGALGVEAGLWGPPMIAMHLPHPGFPWEGGWSLGPGTLGPFHTRIPPGSLVMCIRVTHLPQFGWDFPSFKTESPMSQECPQPGTPPGLLVTGAFMPGLNFSLRSLALHRAGCAHRNALFEKVFYSMDRDPVRKDVPSTAWGIPVYSTLSGFHTQPRALIPSASGGKWVSETNCSLSLQLQTWLHICTPFYEESYYQ